MRICGDFFAAYEGKRGFPIRSANSAPAPLKTLRRAVRRPARAARAAPFHIL